MKLTIGFIVLFIGSATFSISCKSGNGDKESKDQIEFNPETALKARYSKLSNYPVDSLAFPRSMDKATGEIDKVPSKDWTSGFFPGNLWQLYTLTQNDSFKQKAKTWTDFMEIQKHNAGTHDMGFKIFCSFGKGLEVEENQRYKDIVVASAKTLRTRFNKKVGSIRSWDFNADKWEFPVIIDNMMNLELLFEATKISKDSSFYNIAVQHANTTLKNHFRDNGSSFHVVDYDTITGKVRDKFTHQGFNAESAWARGQAWAIYGFTMAHRYTKDARYLEQAEATASFYLTNKNLPEDGIPYWDFDDPDIPDVPRDVSAAAIIASAFFELNGYAEKKIYLNYANKVLNSLKSKEYILDKSVKAPFILDHSTGNWPNNDEIDSPIIYGDFYFLEAMLRKKHTAE